MSDDQNLLTATPPSELEIQKLKQEMEQTELEKEKLKAETEKLRTEISDAKRMWWKNPAVIIPVLGLLISLIGNFQQFLTIGQKNTELAITKKKSDADIDLIKAQLDKLLATNKRTPEQLAQYQAEIDSDKKTIDDKTSAIEDIDSRIMNIKIQRALELAKLDRAKANVVVLPTNAKPGAADANNQLKKSTIALYQSSVDISDGQIRDYNEQKKQLTEGKDKLESRKLELEKLLKPE